MKCTRCCAAGVVLRSARTGTGVRRVIYGWRLCESGSTQAVTAAPELSAPRCGLCGHVVLLLVVSRDSGAEQATVTAQR